MLHRNSIDDVVLALAEAPIDPRTENRVLYSVDWVADQHSMIGNVNEDWVRRELAWFNSGSNRLRDMEGPVPKLFQACAGWDGKVNSAYGHILFGESEELPQPPTLYQRIVDTLRNEGLHTRHAVAIISDRDIHELAHKNDRNDFICTNALNIMVGDDNRLHIIAQMRSMDAVFGYRADYSMWDNLMDRLLLDLDELWEQNRLANTGPVTRGDITFQVANLHVYPRHFELLADVAADTEERIHRRLWREFAGKENTGPSFSERMGLKPGSAANSVGMNREADVTPGSEEDLIRREQKPFGPGEGLFQ